MNEMTTNGNGQREFSSLVREGVAVGVGVVAVVAAARGVLVGLALLADKASSGLKGWQAKRAEKKAAKETAAAETAAVKAAAEKDGGKKAA